MRRLTLTTLSAFAVLTLLSTATAQAASIVSSRAALGPNDVLDWAVLGPDFTAVADPFSRPSADGIGVTVSDGGEGVTRLTQGPSYFGDFAAGDAVIVTSDDVFSGPFSLFLEFVFASPMKGLGLQLQSNTFGPFTMELRLFDAANTPIGTFSDSGVSGDSTGAGVPGTPLYLGAVDTLPVISRAVYTMTAFTPDANGDHFGFAVNQLDLVNDIQAPVPEPATLALLSLGGIAAAARRRRAVRKV